MRENTLKRHGVRSAVVVYTWMLCAAVPVAAAGSTEPVSVKTVIDAGKTYAPIQPYLYEIPEGATFAPFSVNLYEFSAR